MMNDETHTLLCDAVNTITMLKAVFGAPGEHGYNTPEGQALYGLYRLQADIVNLLQKQDAEIVKTEGGAS